MCFLPYSSSAYSTDFRSCTFSRGAFFQKLDNLKAFLKKTNIPSFLDVSYISKEMQPL